jgi:phosphatidylglycerophosphatase A
VSRPPVFALALATGFGVGYAPVAPGTVGSALGLLVWLALPADALLQGIAVAITFVAGWWSAGVAERHFAGTDPGPVVIDEVMGMLATLWLNPVGWGGAALGFLLFRAFDVLKPYPADRLEKLPGGLGIMADDLMAAVYANLALRAILIIPGVLLP